MTHAAEIISSGVQHEISADIYVEVLNQPQAPSVRRYTVFCSYINSGQGTFVGNSSVSPRKDMLNVFEVAT